MHYRTLILGLGLLAGCPKQPAPPPPPAPVVPPKAAGPTLALSLADAGTPAPDTGTWAVPAGAVLRATLSPCLDDTAAASLESKPGVDVPHQASVYTVGDAVRIDVKPLAPAPHASLVVHGCGIDRSVPVSVGP